MEKSAVVRAYLMARRRRAKGRENWRQRQRIRRRRVFARRQSRERGMFAMTLVAAMNLQSVTVRTLWAKERSAHWWDDVVKEVFTQQDWLENSFVSCCMYVTSCVLPSRRRIQS